MKLYDFPFAPNPRKVRVYLAEKGIQVPREMVNLPKGEQNSPEFLKRNPDDAVAERLEPAPVATLGLAHPLRHRSDLAVGLSDDADDPVGFAQLDRAHHDAAVAVESHRDLRR